MPILDRSRERSMVERFGTRPIEPGDPFERPRAALAWAAEYAVALAGVFAVAAIASGALGFLLGWSVHAAGWTAIAYGLYFGGSLVLLLGEVTVPIRDRPYHIGLLFVGPALVALGVLIQLER